MKCKSCTNDVPPKFSHAIRTNICPFCGEQIMDAELQSALGELSVAMEATDQYQEEIYDWLKCNYSLVPEEAMVSFEAHGKLSAKYEESLAKIVDLEDKLANAKPVPKSGKSATGTTKPPSEILKDKNGNALEGEALADPETNSKFFKNALVKQPVDAAQHYKNMVKKIKENGTMAGSEGGFSGGGAITPEMMAAYASGEEADSSEYDELFGGSPINSAVDSDYDDDNDIPAVALQMMNSAKGNNSGDYNARDVAKLQELQKKAARVGNAMNRSGGIGLIRR